MYSSSKKVNRVYVIRGEETKEKLYNKSSTWVSLANIDYQSLEEIIKLGVTKHFKEEKVIINIGEFVEGIYLITKGEARANILTPDGKEKTIFIFEPPFFFGETIYFNKTPASMEVKVMPDSIMTFFSEDAIKKLSKNKYFFELLFRSSICKTDSAIEEISDLYVLTPGERVYKTLWYYANKRGVKLNNGELLTKISQEQIATIVGLHRVTVARIFSRLKGKGKIKNTKRSTLLP
ncbi:MAG: Crp/Fnr family transcriptional regulator [Thermoanaerobacter sp.]|nr:Crp/Fnr family transcriptional regulator [Thermoanaerobacter sp.]